MRSEERRRAGWFAARNYFKRMPSQKREKGEISWVEEMDETQQRKRKYDDFDEDDLMTTSDRAVGIR